MSAAARPVRPVRLRETAGGQHCETTALGVLLGHLGVELSEPLLFGLGGGLGFVYWEAKYLDVPFLGGRSRPMQITRTLAHRLGLTLHVAETSSPHRAWENVAAALDAGTPVGLQLDCYHLEYFTTKAHFAGHVVAMYGYDDTYAYLVDTAPQGGAVRTTLGSLAAARSERGPMSARHLSFTIGGAATLPPLGPAVVAAVRDTAREFLAPPIANLGYRGIEKAAARVPRWPVEAAGLARTAALMEGGGTGGALFRNLYRDFLAEAADLTGDPALRAGHRAYAAIAERWTGVADEIAAAGRTGDAGHLARAGAILRDVAARERAAMQSLAAPG
jgi:hypothetical protein